MTNRDRIRVYSRVVHPDLSEAKVKEDNRNVPG